MSDCHYSGLGNDLIWPKFDRTETGSIKHDRFRVVRSGSSDRFQHDAHSLAFSWRNVQSRESDNCVQLRCTNAYVDPTAGHFHKPFRDFLVLVANFSRPMQQYEWHVVAGASRLLRGFGLPTLANLPPCELTPHTSSKTLSFLNKNGCYQHSRCQPRLIILMVQVRTALKRLRQVWLFLLLSLCTKTQHPSYSGTCGI